MAAGPIVLVSLVIVLTGVACSDMASTQEMVARAQESREDLLSKLTEGMVFYTFTAEYQRDAVSPDPDYPYPHITIYEAWTMAGAEGRVASAVVKTCGLDGKPVSTTVSEGGMIIHMDHLLGETMELPDTVGVGVGDMMGEFSEFMQYFEDEGFALVESSTLNGMDSYIYSQTREYAGGERRWEIELVAEAPLLHRQSTYEVVDGRESLLIESVTLDYKVLPGSEYPSGYIQPECVASPADYGAEYPLGTSGSR